MVKKRKHPYEEQNDPAYREKMELLEAEVAAASYPSSPSSSPASSSPSSYAIIAIAVAVGLFMATR